MMLRKYELSFNKTIYSPLAIRKAVADYSQICNIEVLETEKAVRCIFTDSKFDLRQTTLEFSNYLLEILNSRCLKC